MMMERTTTYLPAVHTSNTLFDDDGNNGKKEKSAFSPQTMLRTRNSVSEILSRSR